MTPIALAVITNEACPECDASIGDLCLGLDGRQRASVHNLRLTAAVARSMEYRKDPELRDMLSVDCPECEAPSGFACTGTTDDGFAWCAGRKGDALAQQALRGWGQT
jgi:hypothetical protein